MQNLQVPEDLLRSCDLYMCTPRSTWVTPTLQRQTRHVVSVANGVLYPLTDIVHFPSYRKATLQF